MKAVFILLCFVDKCSYDQTRRPPAVANVAVYCETCSQNSDCHQTTCADTTHTVICGSGHCTCSSGATGHTCHNSWSDCRAEHCMIGHARCGTDNLCHCTFDGILGGIGGIGR